MVIWFFVLEQNSALRLLGKHVGEELSKIQKMLFSLARYAIRAYRLPPGRCEDNEPNCFDDKHITNTSSSASDDA